MTDQNVDDVIAAVQGIATGSKVESATSIGAP